MKGYKAFEKGLVCKGKQYAENTIFEEENAEVCKCGMHFCENPLDVLDYYPLIDDNGELAEYAEVEALDEVLTDDNKKYCTKKLKIGAKLDLPAFVKASIDFQFEKTPVEKTIKECKNSNSGLDSTIANSGSYGTIANSGSYGRIANSGSDSRIANSGLGGTIANSGLDSTIANSGSYGRIANSGLGGTIANSGSDSRIANSGLGGRIANSGLDSTIANSGLDSRIANSGSYGRIANSGSYGTIANSGSYSVICCAGVNNMVKSVKGCWITLAEWKYDENKNRYIPVCVKTEYVDGKKIKENVFYKLENGEFTEV